MSAVIIAPVNTFLQEVGFAFDLASCHHAWHVLLHQMKTSQFLRGPDQWKY